MEEISTFDDWAYWFGFRLLRGNPNVACGCTRDEHDVYQTSLLYNTSTDTEVKWKWGKPLTFNLG